MLKILRSKTVKKLLGVTFNNKTIFQFHIANLSKASRKLDAMLRINSFIDLEKTLFGTFTVAHLITKYKRKQVVSDSYSPV